MCCVLNWAHTPGDARVDFTAIDFETANSDPASICQVGIATFRQGEPVDLFMSLVNPCSHFAPFNVTIHGIREEDVADAPRWDEVYAEVAARLDGEVVISHTNFDRIALTKACEAARLELCRCRWMDSALVTRRTWTQFARRGFRLPNIAAYLGIDYKAHDALEDARCAGLVVVEALRLTGLSLEEMRRQLDGYRAPMHESGVTGVAKKRIYPQRVTREGNPAGVLHGQVVVFTGELAIERVAAADRAAAIGCAVEANVTRRTTLLVVGGANPRSFAGAGKSSKLVKAEAMQARGHRIRILTESEFMGVMEMAGCEKNV